MITILPQEQLSRIRDKGLDDISPEDLEAFEIGDYESDDRESGYCARVNLPAVAGSPSGTKFSQGSFRIVAIPAKQPLQYDQSTNIIRTSQAQHPTMHEFVVAFPQGAFEKMMPAAFPPLLWLNEALALEKANRRDRALDIIFGEIDKLLRKGDFDTCSKLLNVLDVEHISVNLLIGFLTVTAAAHEFLPTRDMFYSRVEKRLANHPNKDKLLAGLKGSHFNAPRFF